MSYCWVLVILLLFFHVCTRIDGSMWIKWIFNWHRYFNRVFQELDMSHDPIFFLLISGWLPLPGERGSRAPSFKNWFGLWRYRSKPLFMQKIRFLSRLVWTWPPQKKTEIAIFYAIFCCWRSNKWSNEHLIGIIK